MLERHIRPRHATVLSVLIPSSSGLVLEHRRYPEPVAPVFRLNPFFVRAGARTVRDLIVEALAWRLNPFFVRAGARTLQSVRQKADTWSLNPFFVRAGARTKHTPAWNWAHES